jgi:hypothetical protein
MVYRKPMSRGTSVIIATGHGLDARGSIPCRGRDFSLLLSVQTECGALPHIQ